MRMLSLSGSMFPLMFQVMFIVVHLYVLVALTIKFCEF